MTVDSCYAHIALWYALRTTLTSYSNDVTSLYAFIDPMKIMQHLFSVPHLCKKLLHQIIVTADKNKLTTIA